VLPGIVRAVRLVRTILDMIHDHGYGRINALYSLGWSRSRIERYLHAVWPDGRSQSIRAMIDRTLASRAAARLANRQGERAGISRELIPVNPTCGGAYCYVIEARYLNPMVGRPVVRHHIEAYPFQVAADQVCSNAMTALRERSESHPDMASVLAVGGQDLEVLLSCTVIRLERRT